MLDFSDVRSAPDKERLLLTLRGKKADRVPLFENYIDSLLVENILGYSAGNTAAAVGDPYKGDARAVVEGGLCIPMHPDDWIRCNKDEVAEYVRSVVEYMKAGGRYIAGTVSSVNEIPFENFVTMVNSVHRYGRY